jgi:hypothetical protein
MLILNETQNLVDVTGIDDHVVSNLKIGTAAGLVKTTTGETIIVLCHQSALKGDGPTVQSFHQLRAFGHRVDDVSRLSGGTQSITTGIAGYVFPLAFREGLLCLDMILANIEP